MPRKKPEPRHEADAFVLPQDLLERVANFSGDGRKMEAAIGAYVIAHVYGWRTVYMMHTQAHCRELEEIIGGRFADLFDPTTGLTGRSVGMRLVKELGSFWRVAKGKGHRAIRGVFGPDESPGAQRTLL